MVNESGRPQVLIVLGFKNKVVRIRVHCDTLLLTAAGLTDVRLPTILSVYITCLAVRMNRSGLRKP